MCGAQLLEPKLKKILQQVKLKPNSSELEHKPLCYFCGNPIQIPRLKITHGNHSRTHRTDRIQRHKPFDVPFLSYQQVNYKVKRLVFTTRQKLKSIHVEEFRRRDREEGEGLFWNIIFYLNNHGLPYDMILPYKDTSNVDDIEARFDRINQPCSIKFRPDSNISKFQKKHISQEKGSSYNHK